MSRTRNDWMLGAGMLCPRIAAGVVNLVMPHFDEVYRNFGAELSALTWFLVKARLSLLASPLLVLLVWALTPDSRRGAVAFATGIIMSVLMFVSCLVGAYLPIFQMAGTV